MDARGADKNSSRTFISEETDPRLQDLRARTSRAATLSFKRTELWQEMSPLGRRDDSESIDWPAVEEDLLQSVRLRSGNSNARYLLPECPEAKGVMLRRLLSSECFYGRIHFNLRIKRMPPASFCSCPDPQMFQNHLPAFRAIEAV
ncbi:hypothetical protein Nepgr_025831 [Nepenthes gracilis]|uniref:Uncharacterized protein n=1 Tax=Nepenthes gracilis TaxID=150966 RepID=A0AAD3T5R6_NEPGR|nr:hypothetical protein Nepgr_025831 [Nepenthes gracilis]